MKIDPTLPHPTSLVAALHSAVADEPQRLAIVCEDQEITYAEFGRCVVGLARELTALGATGKRVALTMSNSIDMAVAAMAILAAKAEFAPINPFLTSAEMDPLIPACEPQILISDAATANKVQELPSAATVPHKLCFRHDELSLDHWRDDADLSLSDDHLPNADDDALLIFTGGTTGVPKGVQHSHRGLVIGLRLHCTCWPVAFGSEIFLNVAPMFHVWGLTYATWIPMYCHGTLVMIPKYEPDSVIRALENHAVSVFAGGPAPIYMGLLDSPLMNSADFSKLKYCLSGGAPVPEDLHQGWKTITGCAISEGYGMSEGAPIVNARAGLAVKPYSVGKPVPETDVQIVDLETSTEILDTGESGEIRVRGEQFTKGYLNNPKETALAIRDGWLHTGDIGYFDEDGYLFLVDRKKEMIIVGGYNVYPRQVDEILFAHDKIQEAATVGRIDRKLGEVLVAYIVLRAGARMDEDEFFAFCKDSMVKYRRPVAVNFVEALPRTGARKIDKKLLRSWAET